MKLNERVLLWQRHGYRAGQATAAHGELPGMAPWCCLPSFFRDDREGETSLRLYEEAYFEMYLTQATGVTVSEYWAAKEAAAR
jgi:hypothetical protein